MRKALACLAILAAGPASAQGWEFAGSIYAWLPGMDTSFGTEFGTIDSSLSGSSALEALDMAFMGTFEARRDRWGVLGDLLYADLSTSQRTPFDLFGEARVQTKLTAFSGYATYQVYDTDTADIQLGAGFRAFGLDLDTALTAGALPRQSLSSSTSWVVPLVAGRVIAPINDRWFTTAFADVGGLSGDDTTWQAFASLGYRFSERWTAQLGYRYMDIQKEIDGEDAQIELYGPLIGFTVRF